LRQRRKTHTSRIVTKSRPFFRIRSLFRSPRHSVALTLRDGNTAEHQAEYHTHYKTFCNSHCFQCLHRSSCRAPNVFAYPSINLHKYTNPNEATVRTPKRYRYCSGAKHLRFWQALAHIPRSSWAMGNGASVPLRGFGVNFRGCSGSERCTQTECATHPATGKRGWGFSPRGRARGFGLGRTENPGSPSG